MNKALFFLILLLIVAFHLSACSPVALNDTTAPPETKAFSDITAAPETTVAPETTAPLETTAATEERPTPISSGLSFGMPPAETDDLLCFPGVSWGISLDEVLDILKVEESKYELLEVFLRKTVTFYDADWFGQTATRAQMIFDNDELIGIYIEYPADTDMKAVKSTLESIYGSPADSYTRYRRPLQFETGYKKDDVVPIEYASDEQTVFWVSDVHYNDYLGEEGTADWVYRMRASNTGSTAESFNKIAELNPFSHIVWSTNGTGGYTQLNSQNAVVLACDLLRLSSSE